MWDEQDHFSRWVQGICGVLSLAFAAFIFFFSSDAILRSNYHTGYYRDGLGLGALYLAYRCLRYAITGRGNINRDDF